MKGLRILGTRGVPASHGGFENFTEHLALHWSAKNGMSLSIASMNAQDRSSKTLGQASSGFAFPLRERAGSAVPFD